LVTMSWREWARCRGVDPEIFYPPEEDDALEAKSICADCPVREVCLDYALSRREKMGVWGGMTERERRALLRRRPDVTSWRELLERARDNYERQGIDEIVASA